MKLSEAKNNYLTFLLIEKGDAKVTVSSYEKDIEQFIEFIGDKETNEIRVDSVSDYIAFLSERKLSRNTIVRKSTVIRGFTKYLKNEHLTDITIADIELPKRNRRLPKYLTIEEISSILKYFIDNNEPTYYLMMAILVTSGLRVSELVGLRVDNINLNDGYLKIKGKGNKERMIPLNDNLSNTIKDYLEQTKLKGKKKRIYLFSHKNTKPYSRQIVFIKLKECARAIDLKKNISPHTLRHTYASLLLNNGAKLRQVQELLGHSDISTTEIYTHLTDKKIRDEYDLIMER